MTSFWLWFWNYIWNVQSLSKLHSFWILCYDGIQRHCITCRQASISAQWQKYLLKWKQMQYFICISTTDNACYLNNGWNFSSWMQMALISCMCCVRSCCLKAICWVREHKPLVVLLQYKEQKPFSQRVLIFWWACQSQSWQRVCFREFTLSEFKFSCALMVV